jgi:anion-transporting  ArsA/GET3 family ATPase
MPLCGISRMPTHSPSLLDTLSRRQLLVVTGKGGVGKTAVSAALGRAFAARGRRTLVIEVDPRENVHQMLGVPPSGGEIVAAGRDLWVQNLKPRQVLDAVVRETVKIELIARRVMGGATYQHFVTAAPGLKELAILGHALRLLRGIGGQSPGRGPAAPRLDTIVLDAPATGHGVALLAAPALVAEVITSGPFSRMAGELARFIADAEKVGIAVVTQAEEMPVEESLELRVALREKVGREVELLVVNGLWPEVEEETEEKASGGEKRREEATDGVPTEKVPAASQAGSRDESGGTLPVGETAGTSSNESAGTFWGALLELWRRRRALQERELAQLRADWPGPRLELPQLAMDRGPAFVAALTECLERAARDDVS